MELVGMYACCGIGVIHSLNTRPGVRFDELLLQARRSYSAVIITMNEDQHEYWEACMKKNKFIQTSYFENRNSGNTVYIYIKEF